MRREAHYASHITHYVSHFTDHGILQVKELIQLKIESLNYSDNAVGKHNGFVVFVPFGVPEDALLVRIRQIKRNYAIGEIEDIIQPSPYRQKPPCTHFSEGCGGCQWQHIDYNHQLQWKINIIQQALQRIGKLNNLPEIESYSDQKTLGYRNKLRLFSVIQYGKMLLGMKKPNTHKVVPIKRCLICDDKINLLIEQIQNVLSSSDSFITEIGIRETNNEQAMLICFCSKNNRATKLTLRRLSEIKGITSTYSIINDEHNLESGKPEIIEKVFGKSYKIGFDSFFQINRYGLETLINITKECIGYENKLILDAHCGVGTFAIQLADTSEQVLGTDISSTSIELALQNATDNGTDNTSFYKGSAVRVLNSRMNNRQLDAVILDPPRSGCEKLDFLSIMRAKPQKIVYISCNPTTLARDVHNITESGYKLKRLAMIDMFPMTYHLETLAFFTR